jgi:hypothetical protein
MSNGSHTESLSLGEFNRYADFLLLYVARTPPTNFFNGVVGLNLAQTLTGMTNLHAVADDSYVGLDLKQSRKLYNSTPPIRVIFEEGAASGEPSGAPVGRFEHRFASWPIPRAQLQRWFLTPGGKLSGHHVRRGPKQAKARSFSADPHALPATDYTGSSNAIWGPHPSYSWKQIPKGKGLGWITPPLKKKLVVIGSGSLNVWVKTASKDVDLEATVTDVRPNGSEVFVQNGELRASHRKLIKGRSTALQADAEGEVPPAADRDPAVRAAVPPRRPAPDHPRPARWCAAAVGLRHPRPRATRDHRDRPATPLVARAVDGARRQDPRVGTGMPLAAVPAVPYLRRLKASGARQIRRTQFGQNPDTARMGHVELGSELAGSGAAR